MKRYPLPPGDFAGRDLPIETVPTGGSFVRLHVTGREAVHFGKTQANRFDDPKGRYGVCYVALRLEGAFAETCLRAVGAQFVAARFLEDRSFTTIITTAPLRLVPVHGPALARLGATSVVTGGDHALSRLWSRAIHDHPTVADGLLYRANHDNGELCAALFERCRDRLTVRASDRLMADRALIAALLERYKVGLG